MKPLDPSRATGPQHIDADLGDRSSTVANLFREHNRVLVGFLFARLKNEQEAKEVAQEAYVKVLQLEQKPGAASFMRAYLFRVAEHLAVDRIRQRRTRSRLDRLMVDDLFEEALVERAVIAEQELDLLKKVVAELPGKYREAFRLHKLESRGFDEVATLMGLTERMVRRYVSNAVVYILLRREGLCSLDAWKQVQS